MKVANIKDTKINPGISYLHIIETSGNANLPNISDNPGGRKVVAVIDNDKKHIVLQVATSVGHLLMDTFNVSILLNMQYPEADIIFLQYRQDKMADEMIELIKAIIKDRSNSEVIKIVVTKDLTVGVSNVISFLSSEPQLVSVDYVAISNTVRDYMTKYHGDLIEKFSYASKAYLSRSATVPRKFYDNSGKQIATDERVFNEYYLNNFFKAAGFEIVFAEEFENYLSQIAYFMNIKFLAGVTGAGLNSILFMNKGSTVVEIQVPLTTQENNGLVTRYHNQYKEMAKHLDMYNILVPSVLFERDGFKIANHMNKSKWFKNLLNKVNI